ncbi:SGNH/GDSL hydrolase family protein [Janibacter sp. DB-40]|uniref:SGNH/GDSL hydrolase family protein n=1 Tax=Janibacter sp. DB-40 TaxID=3028808 RepID=UPI0024061A39|nr:SGNH/GDSL hydrolase family protein [Janibacter sp. DB-40]
MRTRRTLSVATSVAAAAVVAVVGVSAPAAMAAPPVPEVVQLGDSYSAGNGAGTYTGQRCWRSPDNYGARVAEQMGATYDNVACSGAVVADILEPRSLGSSTTRTATYELPGRVANVERHWLRQAQRQQLCGTPAQDDWYFDYTITDSTLIKGTGTNRGLTATAECQLTAAPQIDAVTKDTDAVFLTIGGNDVGFSTIVLWCMAARNAAACQQSLDAANARIPQLQTDIEEALAAVHERSNGRADIHLLGYPFLLNTDSYGIPEAAPTYDAGAALATFQDRGDGAMAEAMATLDSRLDGPGDLTFVDVKPAWGGHTHGLDPRSTPDNSDAWLVPVGAPGAQIPEWVHPTVEGYQASADALLAAID